MKQNETKWNKNKTKQNKTKQNKTKQPLHVWVDKRFVHKKRVFSITDLVREGERNWKNKQTTELPKKQTKITPPPQKKQNKKKTIIWKQHNNNNKTLTKQNKNKTVIVCLGNKGLDTKKRLNVTDVIDIVREGEWNWKNQPTNQTNRKPPKHTKNHKTKKQKKKKSNCMFGK